MIIAVIILSASLIAAVALVFAGRRSADAKAAEIARLSAENGRLAGESAAFGKIRADLEASLEKLQAQIEAVRRSEAEAVSEKVRLAERNDASCAKTSASRKSRPSSRPNSKSASATSRPKCL